MFKKLSRFVSKNVVGPSKDRYLFSSNLSLQMCRLFVRPLLSSNLFFLNYSCRVFGKCRATRGRRALDKGVQKQLFSRSPPFCVGRQALSNKMLENLTICSVSVF